MGQIKGLYIKHMAEKLTEQYSDKFTVNFEKNKEELEKLVKIDSKKIRNMTAGYIVHLVRKKDKVLSPEIRQPKIEKKGRWRGTRRRR